MRSFIDDGGLFSRRAPGFTAAATGRAVPSAQLTSIFVGETVERFRTESDAIAAFDKFATGTNNCSYTSSSQDKMLLRCTRIPVAGLPAVDSASQVWNAVIQQGSSAPVHGGTQFAVSSGAVDAFGWDNVDAQYRPSLTDIERQLLVVLATRLMGG
jgi:hypothetical protein